MADKYVLYGPNGQRVETSNGIEYMAWTGMGYTTTPPSSSHSGSSGTFGTSGGSSSSAAVNQQAAELERRRQVVAGLTLSDIPEIAAIQKKAQEEYIQTGVWNPKYTEQADAIRKSYNPNYPGGGLGFNESQYILPDAAPTALENILGSLFGGMGQAKDTVTSPSNNGTFALIAIGAAVLLLLRR